MNALWTASMILQWIVIAGLAVMVFSLVRQLGVLSVRLNPAAGLDTGEGPGPGTEIDAREIQAFPTGTFVLGGQRQHPLLIVFLSPDCGVCTAVADYVRVIEKTYRGVLDTLVVVQGTPRVVREFVEVHGIKAPVTLRQHYPNSWAADSTPYGLALTTDGTVAARGVPNALEHLEEMIKAAENGLAMDATSDPEIRPWGDQLPSPTTVHTNSDDPSSERSVASEVVVVGEGSHDKSD